MKKETWYTRLGAMKQFVLHTVAFYAVGSIPSIVALCKGNTLDNLGIIAKQSYGLWRVPIDVVTLFAQTIVHIMVLLADFPFGVIVLALAIYAYYDIKKERKK